MTSLGFAPVFSAASSSLSRFAPIATDVVAGSNADPTSRVRGAAPVGAADNSTTNSIVQPQNHDPPNQRAILRLWIRLFNMRLLG